MNVMMPQLNRIDLREALLLPTTKENLQSQLARCIITHEHGWDYRCYLPAMIQIMPVGGWNEYVEHSYFLGFTVIEFDGDTPVAAYRMSKVQ